MVVWIVVPFCAGVAWWLAWRFLVALHREHRENERVRARLTHLYLTDPNRSQPDRDKDNKVI